MPRIKPYQGTSHARLSQLIRSAQTPVLPATVGFVFGEPTPQGEPSEGETTVDTVAVVSNRSDETVSVQYTRLSVDVLKALPDGEIVPFDPITFPTTMHAILPQVNAGLGLDLVAAEVVDTPLPTIPVNGLSIVINEHSLAWLAGEYFFPYTPAADQPAGRSEAGNIPTDERRRIRVLELPVAEPTDPIS